MNRRGGYSCAYEGCANISGRIPELSFFSFPKDPERQTVWIRNCNKTRLLEKPPMHVHKNYKICGMHFAEKMFLNNLKNRLHTHAVPTPTDGEQDTIEKEIANEAVEHKNEEVLQIYMTVEQSVGTDAISTEHASNQLPHSEQGDSTDVISAEIGSNELLHFEHVKVLSHASTQTSRRLTGYTPGKPKLRHAPDFLRHKPNILKHNMQQRHPARDGEKNMTLKDFERVLHQFLPDNIAKFAIIHARKYRQKTNSERE